MPKTKVNYQDQITFRSSNQFVIMLENGRRYKAFTNKYGKCSTTADFIRALVIDKFIEMAPELIELNGKVNEVEQLKSQNESYAVQIHETLSAVEQYFRNRKDSE